MSSNRGSARLWTSTPLYGGNLPDAHRINGRILDAFGTLGEGDFSRRTHFFGGRFENLYLDCDRIPELEPVLHRAEDCAQQILGRDTEPLHCGFWFNAQSPGSPPPSTRTKSSTSCSRAYTTSPFPKTRETSSCRTGSSSRV